MGASVESALGLSVGANEGTEVRVLIGCKEVVAESEELGPLEGA